MRSGIWLMAVVLTFGGVSADGGVVINMPAPPVTYLADAAAAESPEAPGLGEVALSRYARSRVYPSYTTGGPGGWAWPLGRRWVGYGFGYGIHRGFGWGWPGWGWYRGGYPGWGCAPGLWGWGYPWGGVRWRGVRVSGSRFRGGGGSRFSGVSRFRGGRRR
jgi:hypothetical protein